ncbi:MAG TPA: hypothetical protein VFU07_05640 [Candidatus Lumbricidophila sp.]|nr:hypothetical protein [Candidatus Lumbricidophila sp.]
MAFWQQHQRWPSQSGQDDHETKIGRWLSAQRLAANRNRLRSERRVWLDERAPGWNPTGSQEDRWTRRAHQLSEWCREHNRLPAVTSETGASAGTERQLAHWFKNRRMEHRAGRLPAERELLLSELLGEFWKP